MTGKTLFVHLYDPSTETVQGYVCDEPDKKEEFVAEMKKKWGYVDVPDEFKDDYPTFLEL